MKNLRKKLYDEPVKGGLFLNLDFVVEQNFQAIFAESVIEGGEVFGNVLTIPFVDGSLQDQEKHLKVVKNTIVNALMKEKVEVLTGIKEESKEGSKGEAETPKVDLTELDQKEEVEQEPKPETEAEEVNPLNVEEESLERGDEESNGEEGYSTVNGKRGRKKKSQ